MNVNNKCDKSDFLIYFDDMRAYSYILFDDAKGKYNVTFIFAFEKLNMQMFCNTYQLLNIKSLTIV